MTSGLVQGILFSAAIFGGMTLFMWAREQERRRRWAEAHPVAPGSGRRVLARMRRMVQPAVVLTPAIQAGFSKLGGDPELPAGAAWPHGCARPRTFLAQVDLGNLPFEGRPKWLPGEGRLYAFYDPDGHGSRDVVSIVYSLAPPGPALRPPEGVGLRHPERRVGFEVRASVPSLDWLNEFEPLDIEPEDVEAEFAEIIDASPNGHPRHRLGGYPDEIQQACMRMECAALASSEPRQDEALAHVGRGAPWRLLLQIDSDSELHMNFGDAGRLYVFGRPRDVRKGDFSKTVSIWQTY